MAEFVPRGTSNWIIMLLFLNTLSSQLISCTEKPDPNPEIRDPIYQDLTLQLANTQKDIAEAEKALLEKRAEMEKAEPQKGLLKRAMRLYFAQENIVSKLKQQEKYWIIRISERKKAARFSYYSAFKEKKPWPEVKEYREYLAEKTLRSAKLVWDAKQRLVDAQSARAPASGNTSAHGSAPPPEAHH